MAYTLMLVQKLTVMKNIWHLSRVDGQETPLGTIQQARMKLKEEVTCTTPEGDGIVFTIKARSIVELAATYDIADGSGNALGTMTKNFGASLGRSTYRVETPSGQWTVTETSQVKAIIRRVVGLVADIPWLFRVQFSILDAHGQAQSTATLTLANSAPTSGWPGYTIGNGLGLPIGTNRLWVTVHSRLPVVTAAVDGVAQTVSPSSEGGLYVADLVVDIAPDAQATITLEFAGVVQVDPASTQIPLTLRLPAAVRPVPATVTYAGPDGATSTAVVDRPGLHRGLTGVR